MEPFNTRLHDVIRERVYALPVEEAHLALILLAADKPASVIRALNFVESAADSVSVDAVT